METPPADYDSPWKEIIERFFPEFMAFFFPEAQEAIDWSQGYKFLDKELQQVVREAETGARRVDKLVQVIKKGDGREAWVLIHVEIQGQPETTFAERMYIYNYRLFDRYQRRVASMAILTDTSHSWRPHQFAYELFGCQVLLDFPIAKLLDYEVDREVLVADNNPFAVVTMAHLQTQATRQSPTQRYAAKLNLAKMLYHRGYNRQEILGLFLFIDWIMTLPPELEEQFMTDLIAYEEREQKPYVSSVERLATERGLRRGMEQGLQAMILDTLQIRFDAVPKHVVVQVESITDPDALKTLHRQAVTAVTLDEFLAYLPTQ